jgi:MarR family transcriptional regulator, transcriptional regulator for hemolysin
VLEQDFEESVGHWAHMLSRAFERALNEELAPYGITLRQCQVLGWLALEQELTQSQLAERLRLEPPTLVRILDRMEEAGWVARHPAPDDRRKKLIRPTKRVKPVWERIRSCIRAVRARAMQGIALDDLLSARRVLTAMHSNLHTAAFAEELVESGERGQ